MLSDVDIRRLISEGRLVIEPLCEECIRENGVDLRFSGHIAVYSSGDVFIPGESDPEHLYRDMDVDRYVINPGEHIIFSTIEYIKMPEDHIGLINIRSSYARLGLIIPPTVVDAGYEGSLTVGLYSSRVPVLLRRGDRVLHLLIDRLESPSSRPYMGRYKGFRGVAKPFRGGGP